MNRVNCPVCGNPCVKSGRTKAGTQRWLCKKCRSSLTHKIDTTSKQIFLEWLFGKQAQSEMPGEGRTFRRKTAKFWDVWPMPPKVEDTRDVLFLDGIYLGQESIPMWSIYTQGREGIRLKFECEKDHLLSELFDMNRNVETSDEQSIGVIGKAHGYYDITDWFVDFVQSDICYTDITKIEETFIKIADKYDLNKMAVVKDNAWKFEKESRIIMRMRTTKSNVEIPNIDFFLFPIASHRLKQLEITFSPWMDDVKKRSVKDVVQKYMPDVAVKYKESKFAKSYGSGCLYGERYTRRAVLL